MSVCPDKSNYPLLSTPEHSHFWLLDACAFLPLLGLHASFTRKQRVPKYVAQVLVMYGPPNQTANNNYQLAP
jgi:hypothetical protein